MFIACFRIGAFAVHNSPFQFRRPLDLCIKRHIIYLYPIRMFLCGLPICTYAVATLIGLRGNSIHMEMIFGLCRLPICLSSRYKNTHDDQCISYHELRQRPYAASLLAGKALIYLTWRIKLRHTCNLVNIIYD